MKPIFIIVLIFAIGCNSSGGGSSKSENNTKIPSLNSLQELNGSYNLAQSNNICVEMANNRSATLIITFANNNFNIIEYGFPLPNCFGIPLYEVNGSGSLLISDFNTLLFNKVSETAKILNDSYVAVANSENQCGINNWTYNQARNISGTACAFWENNSFSWTEVYVENNIIKYKNAQGTNQTLYPFKKKSTFSTWTKKSDQSFVVDLYGAQNQQSYSTTIKTILSQSWLNILNAAGRNTTGLVAGQSFECNVDVFINKFEGVIASIDESGYIWVDSPNINEPHYNACLEQDNDAEFGTFNYDAPHIFYIFGENLYIDYFGSADNDLYQNDTWI